MERLIFSRVIKYKWHSFPTDISHPSHAISRWLQTDNKDGQHSNHNSNNQHRCPTTWNCTQILWARWYYIMVKLSGRNYINKKLKIILLPLFYVDTSIKYNKFFLVWLTPLLFFYTENPAINKQGLFHLIIFNLNVKCWCKWSFY